MADAAAASRCSQLSMTSSSRWPASVPATVLMSGVSPWGAIPRTVATAAGTESGSPTAASSTTHTPSGNSPASSAPTSTRHARLAYPGDAGQRDEPALAHELGDVAHQLVPADERGDLPGQVPRKLLGAAQHWELGREPVGDDLEHRDPPAQPAQQVLTERPQRPAGAQQHLGGVGHEYLAAVRERRRAGRPG